MQDRGYPADFFQLVSQSPEVGSTNLQEKQIVLSKRSQIIVRRPDVLEEMRGQASD